MILVWKSNKAGAQNNCKWSFLKKSCSKNLCITLSKTGLYHVYPPVKSVKYVKAAILQYKCKHPLHRRPTCYTRIFPFYSSTVFIYYHYLKRLLLGDINGWNKRSFRFQSLSGEACNCTHTPERAEINLHIWKFLCSNKYYKHCIEGAKIVFTIIFLIMNILTIFNKNIHNNKLHNGLETWVHFLEISLKFKYFWNIARGVTRE